MLLVLGVPVWLDVSAALALGVTSAVPVLDGDTLGEGVPVEEPDGVPEGDEGDVGDEEALRRLAMLRPR